MKRAIFGKKEIETQRKKDRWNEKQKEREKN